MIFKNGFDKEHARELGKMLIKILGKSRICHSYGNEKRESILKELGFVLTSQSSGEVYINKRAGYVFKRNYVSSYLPKELKKYYIPEIKIGRWKIQPLASHKDKNKVLVYLRDKGWRQDDKQRNCGIYLGEPVIFDH